MFVLLPALLGLVSLGSCGTLVEKILEVPAGWKTLDDKVEKDQLLKLSFALREPKIGDLASRITSGQLLSLEEARALRQPDEKDVKAVQKWLADNGIKNAEQDHDWIHVYTTVAEAEPLLEMTLQQYQFEDQSPVLRAKSYEVPDDLENVIHFVHPISNFMTPKRDLTSLSRPSQPKLDGSMGKRAVAPCAGGVTPECLRKLYNYPPVDITNQNSSVRLGIAGFLEEFANFQDADSFLHKHAADIASTGYNYSVGLVNGGTNPQDPTKSGGEAALDIQYALAMGFPANITYYSTAGRGVKLDDTGKPLPLADVDNEPYLEFFQYFLDKPDDQIPHVLSFSYADDELTVPRPYAERVCDMIGLLTARGTSILIASGDGGAAGSRSSTCKTLDGKEATMAVFPSTCPWATGIGATRNNVEPPPGASLSGGGFSQYFARPDWQRKSVEGYVSQLNGLMNGKFDPMKRAVPDIAAVGTSFEVIVGGAVSHLDGTSASTPVVATMIAMANGKRIAAGKPPLGWLNGYLYSDAMKSVLQDITQGVSMACPWNRGKGGGWPAKKGWDAITGLGVPKDVQRFVDVLAGV